MLVYILFFIGFYALTKGAHILITGATAIARHFQVPDMLVGLTIVSFGTSLPELLVNVISSVNGQSALAIGNIFGSNVANLLLIIGVSAVIRPLALQHTTVLTEIPFSLIATLLVGFLANTALFDQKPELYISRIDGAVLLLFFAMFLSYIVHSANNHNSKIGTSLPDNTTMPLKKAGLLVVLGAAGLFVGGKWIVDGAIEIAQHFGWSEGFIGLTIVAIGTSLPELITSAMAAYRHNSDIAVGNVIGSNIFNLLWVLGVSAVINPLPFNEISNTDIVMMIFSSTLLIFVLPFGRKNKIGRTNGLLFLVIYGIYLAFLIKRG